MTSLRMLLRLAPLACAAMTLAAAPTLDVDLSRGEVDIRLHAEPGTVAPDRNLLVTLTVTAPRHLDVRLPDLRDRFSGFTTAEGFSRDPVDSDGRRRRETVWKLIPSPARDYRLAPFAVEVHDTTQAPAGVTSFATRPVRFPAQPLAASADGDVEIAPRPFWIAPTRRMVLGWIALGLLGAAAVAGLLWLLRRVGRHVRELRLSPRERAFAELGRLLERHLVEKGLYKDFYIELTQVVRRYIERSHGIRAPEQTTPEFLAAAARHPHFTPEVLASLRDFLESADLEKFAPQERDPQPPDRAVQPARDYVERDAATAVPVP